MFYDTDSLGHSYPPSAHPANNAHLHGTWDELVSLGANWDRIQNAWHKNQTLLRLLYIHDRFKERNVVATHDKDYYPGPNIGYSTHHLISGPIVSHPISCALVSVYIVISFIANR